MDNKLQRNLELILLSLIITLQIADFLEILPGDLDYIKKIISWAALGYLFVKASPTNIILGNKKPRFDTVIILTYFFFIITDMIRFAQVAIEEAVLFRGFYGVLIAQAPLIEKYSFYLGAILLVFISLYAALKFSIKKPSFLANLQEKGKPPTEISKIMTRFIIIYLILVAFFILIFNLASEWLAIALDAPLTMIAIFLYLFVVIRYHKKFNPTNFIHKIGSVGEKFYKQFIEMFHYKRTFYLGVMGLLALHLLTDIGNFIIPYLIGLKDILYFGRLGGGHTALIQLLISDIKFTQGIASISLVVIYILNAIAMLFLLVLPTFVWYRLFKKKMLHVSRTTLALVFSSLICFLLTPAFSIKKIQAAGIAGVDILTKSILNTDSIINMIIMDRVTSIIIVAIASLILGIILWALEFNKKIEKDAFIIAVLTGLIFFGFYIFYYFISLYQYYINTIKFLLGSSEFLIAFYFSLFAIMTVLFYVGGYIFFIYEFFKKHFFKRFNI